MTSMSLMSDLAKTITNLKAKQVEVVAGDHIKVICSTISNLMSGSDINVDQCNKLRVDIANHCEKLSLYAACLPEHATLRVEMIDVSKFAKTLCAAGVVSCQVIFQSDTIIVPLKL